jgi:hypothetical protein
MGEALIDAERETFAKLTGRKREPLQRIEELVAVSADVGARAAPLPCLPPISGGCASIRLWPASVGYCLPARRINARRRSRWSIARRPLTRYFDLKAESFEAALAEIKTRSPAYTFLGTWVEAREK